MNIKIDEEVKDVFYDLDKLDLTMTPYEMFDIAIKLVQLEKFESAFQTSQDHPGALETIAIQLGNYDTESNVSIKDILMRISDGIKSNSNN